MALLACSTLPICIVCIVLVAGSVVIGLGEVSMGVGIEVVGNSGCDKKISENRIKIAEKECT